MQTPHVLNGVFQNARKRVVHEKGAGISQAELPTKKIYNIECQMRYHLPVETADLSKANLISMYRRLRKLGKTVCLP